MVSVGVGGVVAGTKGAENGSGAGEIRPATPNAKLDARGEAEADAVGTVVTPDHTEWVIAGTVGTVKAEEIGNTELAKRGEAVGKIGSVFLVFAAVTPENDRKAFNISSAFWKNILSR